MELVVVRRPEDAHHPGHPRRADQRCDHPPLGLGHVSAYAGGPQDAPPLLPGPPQRNWLPPVSIGLLSNYIYIYQGSPIFLKLRASSRVGYNIIRRASCLI